MCFVYNEQYIPEIFKIKKIVIGYLWMIKKAQTTLHQTSEVLNKSRFYTISIHLCFLVEAAVPKVL